MKLFWLTDDHNSFLVAASTEDEAADLVESQLPSCDPYWSGTCTEILIPSEPKILVEMMNMNVYTCTNFVGHWPVGTSAIVVASDEEMARCLLSEKFELQGLKLDDHATMVELNLAVAAAIVLTDGDY